jgi:hypothetical protein
LINGKNNMQVVLRGYSAKTVLYVFGNKIICTNRHGSKPRVAEYIGARFFIIAFTDTLTTALPGKYSIKRITRDLFEP